MPGLDGADPERRRARFAQWRSEWEPGTRFEYHAGSAHWVLADLIERVTGTDFRDFVEQRVTRPLGLPRVLGIPEDEQGDIAPLVRVGDGTDQQVMLLDEPSARAMGAPGGGAIMRAADLALFYQALLHNPEGLWDAAVLDDATTNVRCVLPDNLLQVPVNRTLGLVVAGDDGQHVMRYGSFGQANGAALVRARGRARSGRLGRSRHGVVVRVLHQRDRRRRGEGSRARAAPLRHRGRARALK